jgi:putative DNA primase/helicase
MQLQYTAARSARRVDYEYITRVRMAAEGRWFSLLPKLGVPVEILTGETTKCPVCGGAFRFLDTRGRGEFVCRKSLCPDITGDGFALVRHLGEMDFAQAVRTVGHAAGQLELPETRQRARRPQAWGGTVDRWALGQSGQRRGVA